MIVTTIADAAAAIICATVRVSFELPKSLNTAAANMEYPGGWTSNCALLGSVKSRGNKIP